MGRLARTVKHRLAYVCVSVSFLLIIYIIYVATYNNGSWNNLNIHFKIKIPNAAVHFDEELTERYRNGYESYNYNKFKEVDYNQNNVMFLFNKARSNKQLQIDFKNCIVSLLSKTSKPLTLFHIVGDIESLRIADAIFQSTTDNDRRKFQVTYHEITQVLTSVLQTVANIHVQLSAKVHHFSDPMFYISLVIHKIMPANITRLIILDVDLIFMSDLAALFTLFKNFSADQAIGIARENQPVYRNVFWDYRRKNPGTRVGEPPPDGLTGFNSGVVLFDLDKLRNSPLYNSFLTGDNLLTLVRKYEFKGHLGDQDFFTLLSLEYGSLFYILPCGWNRQLCMWWRRDEFVSVFSRYYSCSGPVHILHSNCNTSMVVRANHSRPWK